MCCFQMPGPLETKSLQYKLTASFRKLERAYQEPCLVACWLVLLLRYTFFPNVGVQLNMLFSGDS